MQWCMMMSADRLSLSVVIMAFVPQLKRCIRCCWRIGPCNIFVLVQFPRRADLRHTQEQTAFLIDNCFPMIMGNQSSSFLRDVISLTVKSNTVNQSFVTAVNRSNKVRLGIGRLEISLIREIGIYGGGASPTKYIFSCILCFASLSRPILILFSGTDA